MLMLKNAAAFYCYCDVPKTKEQHGSVSADFSFGKTGMDNPIMTFNLIN